MNEKKQNKIMVCVTQQKSCERLIERGAQSCKIDDELFIVHVVKDDWKYFSEMKESDALEYLFDISKNHGAVLSIINTPDIETALSDFAKRNNINNIIMGESREKQEQQNMIKRLKKKIKNNVKFNIVLVDN